MLFIFVEPLFSTLQLQVLSVAILQFENLMTFFLLSVLQLVAFRTDEQLETRGHCLPSMAKLLLDPYIIIVAGFPFYSIKINKHNEPHSLISILYNVIFQYLIYFI